MSESYDPKSVFKVLKKAGRPVRPVGKKVGPAYDLKQRPPAFCFPLQAWIDKHEALPEDIRALPLVSGALRGHVRPDGSVYCGAYELPNQPQSTIIVFGDALLSHEDAIAASVEFRRRLERIAWQEVKEERALDEQTEEGFSQPEP